MIDLDIETRSTLNVVTHGLYRHAPTAKILGMQYTIDGGPLTEWRGYFADGITPELSDAPPQDLLDAVNSGMMIVAHNAAYERVVLREQDWWPDVPVEQFICSAAWAACFNLPRGLDALTRMLLPADQAKMQGMTHTKYMWSADMPFVADSGDHMDLQMAYCGRDVTSMRAVLDLLPPFDPTFIAEFHASEHVNDRGVMIDRQLVDAMLEIKPRIERSLMQDLDRATGGGVKLRGPSFLQWLQRELPEEQHPLLMANKKTREGYGFKTVKKLSSDKSVRAALLEQDELPSSVRNGLLAFGEANKATVTKFAAASARASDDDILRGQFMYAGAGQTRRFSSQGLQFHNMKRDVAKDAMHVIETLIAHKHQPDVIPDLLGGRTLNEAASSVMRPTFKAPEGRTLFWGDWSSIEARMLPWLSADDRAEPVLDVFRNGGDLYKVEAGNIYKKDAADVDKDERQIGKVAVLSLGYQGGVGAFQSMAKNYGVEMTDKAANGIKVAWREANPWAPDFWAKLQQAGMDAINCPMELFKAGRVRYQFIPDLLRGTLICWLPSGGWVSYPEAKIRDIPAAWDEDEKVTAICFKHPTYGASSTYGGSMCENITQAESGALLRRAVVMCEEAGLETVAHVHDEIIAETDDAYLAEDMATLERIMADVPHWAAGLPLAADAECGLRYKVQLD